MIFPFGTFCRFISYHTIGVEIRTAKQFLAESCARHEEADIEPAGRARAAMHPHAFPYRARCGGATAG